MLLACQCFPNTGLGGGLSCVRFVGNMVTLGVNAVGVSVGTLGDGAGNPF